MIINEYRLIVINCLLFIMMKELEMFYELLPRPPCPRSDDGRCPLLRLDQRPAQVQQPVQPQVSTAVVLRSGDGNPVPFPVSLAAILWLSCYIWNLISMLRLTDGGTKIE